MSVKVKGRQEKSFPKEVMREKESGGLCGGETWIKDARIAIYRTRREFKQEETRLPSTPGISHISCTEFGVGGFVASRGRERRSHTRHETPEVSKSAV